jgi:hypothetical protein
MRLTGITSDGEHADLTATRVRRAGQQFVRIAISDPDPLNESHIALTPYDAHDLADVLHGLAHAIDVGQ